jgi:hypothetical protein
MSTKEEEIRSLMWARKFFMDLLDTRLFPKVPRAVRNTAYTVYQMVDRLETEPACSHADKVAGLNAGRDFLLNLLDPVKTPRVPGDVRDLAFRISKHYPMQYTHDLKVKGRTLPEPLYKGGSIWA